MWAIHISESIPAGDVCAMNSFQYFEPKTVAEAAQMLADYGDRAHPLAGGTDLLIQMDTGRRRPDAVVYLGRIPELGGITEADGGLRIGAAATLREVEIHPMVRERYPALQRGAAEVGSLQIRNLATLAGNVANASPSADTAPALLALDATVELQGSNGTRTVTLPEFWSGPGRTTIQPGELITAIHLPAPRAGQKSWYRKLAVRKAMDLAMVGVCVSLVRQNGTATDVRIALGAVAPVVVRATESEEVLAAGDVTASRIEEAAERAVAATSPIDDQRASAKYRREMVRMLTRRALQELLA